jgi:HK97 family phage major capsid protein
MSLPAVNGQPGTTVTVPYFNTLGEFEELSSSGSLTPVTLADSKETATVKHYGQAFNATWLGSEAAAGSKLDEAVAQMTDGIVRKIDSELITIAKSETNWSSYIHDGAATQFTIDHIFDARALFGDEDNQPAVIVVHSQVAKQMRKSKTSTGAPLLVDPTVNGALATYAGVPVYVSDKLTATNGVYTSLLLQRNAMVAWVAGNKLAVARDYNVLNDSDTVAIHVYAAMHRYKTMAGRSKPGVVLVKSKA